MGRRVRVIFELSQKREKDKYAGKFPGRADFTLNCCYAKQYRQPKRNLDDCVEANEAGNY